MANNRKPKRAPKKGGANSNERYNSRNFKERPNYDEVDSKSSTKRGGRSDRSNGRYSDNDPSWWNKTGQLARDAASYSFNHPIGARLPSFQVGQESFTASGIMRIDYASNLGTIRGEADPINVAARQMYDVINAKNSRNPSYDASDLMMYVIAVANAWSLHAWMKRAIGLMLTYSPTNRYVPDAILESMGIAPLSAQNDITSWRNVANQLALKLNMLAVPAHIDYFKRVIFMNQFLYQDDPTNKYGLMYFNPMGFLQYRDPDDDHDAGYLKFVNFHYDETNLTPTVVETYIKKMIAPLFNSTDFATMSSDIIKAYGMENCFRLPAIDETETTVPQYNPEVLTQINNAMAFPDLDAIQNYEVTQDMNRNCLRATLQSNSTSPASYHEATRSKPKLLNMPMDNPTIDDVLVATRLMFATGNNYQMLYSGLEVVYTTKIFFFAEGEDNSWSLDSKEVNPLLFHTAVTDEMFDKISKYNQFHAAPLMYYIVLGQSGSYTEMTKHLCLSDIQNYTTLSSKELANLHEAALISIFSPMGK